MKAIRCFSKVRKAKTYIPAHYEAIPEHLQPQLRDIHDTYPLKSLQEVIAYQEINPPDFKIDYVRSHYSQGDQNGDGRNMGRKAIIRLDMQDMRLSTMQQKRMRVILGPRIKEGHTKFKLTCEMYPEHKQNFVKVMEQLREIYWESLRAP